MKKVNFRRVFVVAALASLVLVYSMLWLRMITTPLEYTGADFIAFYAAGRIAQIEGPAHVYDLALQQHYEEQVVGFEIAPEHISPFLHPPFIVPLAQAFARDDYILSFVLWDLVMLVFLVLGGLLLFNLLREGLSRQQRLVLLAGILLFFPCYASLVIGQDSAIFYCGACLWMFGLLTKKDWLAGLGLAGMTVRPHLTLPLALPFLFKRRGVWWWFLIGAASLALFSLAYVGVDGIEGFFRVLMVSGRGENYHTGEEHMFNSIGLLVRTVPALPRLYVRWTGWGTYLLVMIGLCVLWAKVPRLEERHISLAVILILFTAPHSHVNDLVLLIVPVVGLLLVMVRKRYILEQDVVLLPLGVSLVLLFSFFTESLKYSLSYLMMLVLLLAVWFPEKLFRRKTLQRME